MRIASLAPEALVLGVFCAGAVLSCGSSDAGSPGAAGTGGTAGRAAGGAGVSAGGSSAGASSGGSAGLAAGGGGLAGHSSGGAGAGGVSGSVAGGGAGGLLGGAGGGAGGSGHEPLFLTSPAITAMAGCSKDNVAACAVFPIDNVLTTIGGNNHSPELDFGAGPPGTQSFAIVLHDDSNDYTHWAIWNIPANAKKLPASLPNGPDPAGLTGVRQVSFFMSGDGYAGPGAHLHVYQFKVYALKVATFSPTLPGSNPQTAVRAALEADSDVIATADLRGATGS